MATTFKSYSEKSKAVRALVQVYNFTKDMTWQYLAQVDSRWGFTVNEFGVPALVQVITDADYGVATTENGSLVEAGTGALIALPAVQAPSDDEVAAPSASAFGSFALSQLTAPSNTAPVEPQRTSNSQRITGLKIEKNREERNGVKMPSVGGMCRAVWDALSSMSLHIGAGGATSVPTVAEIKALAEKNGWNVNNASIEYYQWRKWHGISGRGKKSV